MTRRGATNIGGSTHLMAFGPAVRRVRAGAAVLSAFLLAAGLRAGEGALSAKGRGPFNIGPSQGAVTVVTDAELGKPVFKFDFNAPAGSVVGVWTKDFPAAVTPASSPRIVARVKGAAPVPPVEIALEIKGAREVQRVPLVFRAGWARTEAAVDWNRVGALREVVFVVTPAPSQKAAGTVYLDFEFAAGLSPAAAPAAGGAATSAARAPQRGFFNIGRANGKVSAVSGPDGAPVLRLEYAIDAKGVGGVWTKGYAGLSSAQANAVRLWARAPSSAAAQRLSVTAEIKGSKDAQRIPVPLSVEGRETLRAVDWKAVGALREVVFVVTPISGRDETGALEFDAAFVKRAVVPAAEGARRLADAPERGAFNIGRAQGAAVLVADPSLGRGVLRFDYTAQPKGVAGLWTKGYSDRLSAEEANAVRVAAKGSPEAAGITLEIKGARDTQRIPVVPAAGWAPVDRAIDWDRVGKVKEVVFVVAPTDSARKSSGRYFFDLAFVKAPIAPAPAGFGLLSAGEKGVFTMGTADGRTLVVSEEAAKKDVVRFDYNVSSGAVGLWTRSYPAALTPAAANAVNAAVKSPSADPGVTVALELKGAKGAQTVPLPLKAGWSTVERAIDWASLGDLKEAVFVVAPRPGAPARGSLYFDLTFLQGAALEAGDTAGAGSPFNILNAAQRGVFNIGAAEGQVRTEFNDLLKRDALRFDFAAPTGTVIGVWSKSYPAELTPAAANGLRAAVHAADAAQAAAVAMSIEIKGAQGTQVIEFPLSEGWNTLRDGVDWDSIGALNEAVFVLRPAGGPAKGVLWLDLEFVQGDFVVRREPTVGGKIGLVLLSGFLFYLLVGLARRLAARGAARIPKPWPAGIARDAATALVMVATLGGALAVYRGGLGAGLVGPVPFLWMGLWGALLAEGFTRVLAGRGATSAEAFRHFVYSGLTALSASPQTLWLAPTSAAEIFFNNAGTAGALFALYHGLNAAALSRSGRPLRAVTGALATGLPTLFGALLALQSGGFLRGFADVLTAGALSGRADLLETLGRVLLIFGVNEAAANAVGLAARGRPLTSARGHLLLFIVSLAVVVAPQVADLGSSTLAAALPPAAGALAAVAAAMASQGALWAEVYLVSGLVLDGIYGYPPERGALFRHAGTGLRKGVAFSGLFLAILYGLKGLLSLAPVQRLMDGAPIPAGILLGALAYPFVKAVIESFDGSMSFFRRTAYSYRQGVLYVRGAAAGAALALGVTGGWMARSTEARLAYGLLAGLLVSAGVSLARDAYYGATRRGRIGGWKIYWVDGLLGGFIGAALAFYLDSAQASVLADKFRQYTASGAAPQNHTIYALLSKWGRVDLGAVAGGAKLLFNESLAGVITWSIAAWLFAINRVFLAAYFQKDKQPIRHFFSRDGLTELGVNMIHVLRWGLWMAPIINTGLRMMAEATWYNQDGAVRSLIAIFKNLTLSPADFQVWSLGLFVSLLAHDLVRILIWVDHMGLRVATLVNLSFLGMDKLDERLARFIGPEAAQRTIPEGVKRFTTWAPLLIPFYIPRGADWDRAWDTSQKMIQARAAEAPFLTALGPAAIAAGALGLLALLVFLFAWTRRRAERRAGARERSWSLSNRTYRVTVKENGEAFSEVTSKGYDVTRRSYDTLDPAGRTIFLVDTAVKSASGRVWPLIGNYPRDRFDAPTIERAGDGLRVSLESRGVSAVLEISLPDADAAAELWTVTLRNAGSTARSLAAVPYVEWVLDRPDSDKGHTQYGRLFPEMEYVRESNAVLAWQKKNKTMGFLAVDAAPSGFCTSRMDFIGRARGLWSPRLLETLAFLDPQDTAGYPTFDPIAALRLGATLAAGETKTFRLLLGFAKNREEALAVLHKHLKPTPPPAAGSGRKGHRSPLIGHGEIPPGTPQPYADFSADGNTLEVHTPYTPRPFDHALSNAVGHYVMVTNRGLHTTSNGNSQQNPVTPDWPDTVTRELPAEAIYLYDPEEKEWFSPTHHPLNDRDARNTASFSVDGTAVFRMSKGSLSTELTVFVPPREPLGVYRLTVRNGGPAPRRLRVAPYFQIVLAGSAEPRRRPLAVKEDKSLDALYFENPVNAFRWGPAFASMSLAAERMETRRGRFVGTGRGVDRPALVETGEPDWTQTSDDRPIAGFLGTLEIPAGAERTVVVVLGQIDTRERAAALIRKYKSVEAADAALEETRGWWNRLVGTVRLETTHSDFDRYQNWLKYQAVAERIWARRGFYQTSGAFGFRDQLQDSVNLVWVDPALARKQILLHASQQFIEGDVVHWFHTLHDGRTAFSNRSHASDNLLWLAWAAAEYVRLTGDESILEEMTTYLRAENPFLPLPHNKHGWGTIYPRSTRGDTLYRHCLKAVDLVLEKRMGAHGIPLIATGDWNDGLDEIGSEGRGESVWLGFFLLYILKNSLDIIEKKDGRARRDYYLKRAQELEAALEKTWRGDRYLRAIHDDGTEIGVKDSGVWEIDALTAAWAVMAGLNPERARTVFQTALKVLERDNVILLGWPALREDTKPYLGRSSHYPEGVRENGMYCHGVQWLVRAARILAEKAMEEGDKAKAREYRDATFRLWMKIAPLSHVAPGEIEVYGGQPNKQAADFLTTFDQGRMIWHGYTGAAGWMLRQAFEGVAGATLSADRVVLPSDMAEPRGPLRLRGLVRDLSRSPLRGS